MSDVDDELEACMVRLDTERAGEEIREGGDEECMGVLKGMLGIEIDRCGILDGIGEPSSMKE